MFPTILELGPLHVRSYGLLLAFSFVLGISWAARRARAAKLDADIIYGVAWIVVIGGVVGARLMFVLQHPGEFWSDPLAVLKVWRGGLTLYGGLILASLGTILYVRRHSERPWVYTDVLAPFVALGEGITRLGCFLNGCCFGKRCELPWAVTFPADSLPSAHLGYPHAIHPTQIYQAILGVLLFLGLSWLWRRRRFDGQVFFAFVFAEGVVRFVTDFARYYEPEQVTPVGGLFLSESQFLSLAFVLIGALGFGTRRQRHLAAGD